MKESRGLAVFLGAGFSKWAAGLPLASELFDFQIEPFGVKEEQKLQRVRRLKEAWDNQHSDGTTEQFIAYALSRSFRDVVLWYIGRRLSEPYIWAEWHAGRWRRHVLMLDENRKLERPGVVRARDFLIGLGDCLTGVITTNYDLLIEYAFGTNLFNYGQRGRVLTGRGAYPVSQWLKPIALKGSLPVAKMHGSLSWDSRGRYTDGRRGLTGDALIVAPTPEKEPPPLLTDAWDLAARILDCSSRVLVFGFAFNPYDEALSGHLTTHGRGVSEVMILDVEPNIERANQVWPRAEVRTLQPPPESGPELSQWLSVTTL